MKRLLAFSLIGTSFLQPLVTIAATPARQSSAASQTKSDDEPLNNKDVIMMTKSGLSPAVITAKIKASACHFDTSVTALQELKSAGIPDSLILTIVEAPSGRSSSLTVANIVPPAAALPAIAQPQSFGEVKVPDGTFIEVQTSHTVSSADYEVGSAISFNVVQPVKINGVTVVEQGATATARIVKAEGGKSFGRSGKLGWEMKEVTAVDGSKIPLSFNKGVSGSSAGGTVAAGIIVTSLLFWPAAPFWGFKKGKAAILPAGKRFEAFVHGDAAVRATPGLQADAHNRAGMTLFSQRRLSDAENAFRMAVRLEPSNALYRHNLGAVLSNQQRFEEAEAEIREAVRLNPNEQSFAHSLAMVIANKRSTRQVMRVQ